MPLGERTKAAERHLMAAPSAGWCSNERALGRANQTSTAPCSWQHHPQDGAPMSGGRGGVAVFAVEDTTAQVTWHDLPAGTVVSARDAMAEVAADGPGAAVLAGLPPDTALEVSVATPERLAAGAGGLYTLAPPPGPERCRVATVSDCHLGGEGFGHLPRVHHPAGAAVHTTCL